MYAGQDFAPAEMVESELFGLDFVNDLGQISPGEQLVSATFEIGVVSGEDPTPQNHLNGIPFVMVNPNNNTGLVTLAVQRVTGLLAGVQYWLQADCITTNSNTISLWARIPPENPSNIWNPPR